MENAYSFGGEPKLFQSSPSEYVLILNGITKRYPGVLANDNVSLKVRKAAIHAIVGENGAGKSTLMKITAGIVKPDRGEIIVNGKSCNFRGPLDAYKVGIGMVHQEFMLVEPLSILENVVLGYEPRNFFGFIKKNESMEKIKSICKNYSLQIPAPLNSKVTSLPVSIRQRVEIVKALYRTANILILDEPTAVLAPQEIQELLKALKFLKNKGTTILFITHKLNEVFAIADWVTVMRQGKVQGTFHISETNEEKIAELMVGKDANLNLSRRDYVHSGKRNKPILSVKDVSLISKTEHVKSLYNISFSVKKGEIVGIAGVAGNGQAELIEIIMGLRRPTNGYVYIKDRKFVHITPINFRTQASYIPQDRIRLGSSQKQTLWENIIVGLHKKTPFSKAGFLKKRKIFEYAGAVIKEYDVKAPSIFSRARNLSGGNLQKLILGRELKRMPALLVAEDPTRGLDIAATEYVRKKIVEFAMFGGAVLLSSQDLQELLLISDRILVMFNGKIVAELETAKTNAEEVGRYMLGIKEES